MTRLELKRILGRQAKHLRLHRRRDVILLYHSIGDSPWAVRANDFKAQMEWLCTAARVVSLSALIDNEPCEPLRVAVTFDDGYASLFAMAGTVGRELRLPATVFLNTGLVRRDRREQSQPRLGHYPDEQFLLWGEVEQLVADDWVVGSHGVAHLDFTRADDDVVRAQLHESKAAIERHLSVTCRYFAYTWGRHSSHLEQLVAEAGYECAFTGVHGPVRRGANPMAVPRINISQDYSLDDFKAIIRGDWDYIGWHRRLHGG
jgi:peptidoglycan/xylan/chitin deacetylase (PgdA/CDA1 family)